MQFMVQGGQEKMGAATAMREAAGVEAGTAILSEAQLHFIMYRMEALTDEDAIQRLNKWAGEQQDGEHYTTQTVATWGRHPDFQRVMLLAFTNSQEAFRALGGSILVEAYMRIREQIQHGTPGMAFKAIDLLTKLLGMQDRREVGVDDMIGRIYERFRQVDQERITPPKDEYVIEVEKNAQQDTQNGSEASRGDSEASGNG